MEGAAIKANVGTSRKKSLDVKINPAKNEALEQIQEECYQELVMVRDSLSIEFHIKANSIVSLEVRIRYTVAQITWHLTSLKCSQILTNLFYIIVAIFRIRRT